MGFSKKIKTEILVKSARHCCCCRRYKGLKIEVHHIKPQHLGGDNTLENAIALCLDCHADAGHYNDKHPKGSKFSPEELFKCKEEWFKIVSENKIESPKSNSVELVIDNKNYLGNFTPIFIREKTTYTEDCLKSTAKLLGKNPLDYLHESQKQNTFGNPYYVPFLNSLKTYDEYIDFLNGDYPKKDYLKTEDENENIDCQPTKYHLPSFMSSSTKEINLSNCILNLKFINHGPEVLEDYKIYLSFENVVQVDSVNKSSSFTDLYQYKYNVKFSENKGEFVPEKTVLVQKDFVIIDPICFRTNHKVKEVIIKWELYARNIFETSTLKLEIKPKIEIEERRKIVKSSEDVKTLIRILPKVKFE